MILGVSDDQRSVDDHYYASLLGVLAPIIPGQEMQKSQSHIEWLAKSLKEIQTITAGMRRGDLLRVFTTEGGLSNRLQRRYVYRGCPYIKVDVKFDPVGKPTDAQGRATGGESAKDVIESISEPFLQWIIVD